MINERIPSVADEYDSSYLLRHPSSVSEFLPPIIYNGEIFPRRESGIGNGTSSKCCLRGEDITFLQSAMRQKYLNIFISHEGTYNFGTVPPHKSYSNFENSFLSKSKDFMVEAWNCFGESVIPYRGQYYETSSDSRRIDLANWCESTILVRNKSSPTSFDSKYESLSLSEMTNLFSDFSRMKYQTVRADPTSWNDIIYEFDVYSQSKTKDIKTLPIQIEVGTSAPIGLTTKLSYRVFAKIECHSYIQDTSKHGYFFTEISSSEKVNSSSVDRYERIYIDTEIDISGIAKEALEVAGIESEPAKTEETWGVDVVLVSIPVVMAVGYPYYLDLSSL